jgi:hypothetical protein
MAYTSLKTNVGDRPAASTLNAFDSAIIDIYSKLSAVTQLNGTTSISTTTSNVKFFGLGNITVFNPSTDILEVYMDSVRLTQGVHYKIADDHQSIDSLKGPFDGTSEPLFFEFAVTRNQVNNLIFSDGASIAAGSIPLTALDPAAKIALNNVSVTKLTGTTTVSTSVSNVTFVGLGNISVFNPSTDALEVYAESVKLVAGVHYKLAADQKSIDALSGNFDGTADPILFEFVVTRNQANNLVFSDGSSIKAGTIPLAAFDPDTQTKLSKITIAKLIGSTSVNTAVTNIVFVGLGEITVFNPNTDALEVFMNSVRLTKNVHYKLGTDNKSIDSLIGTIDGTTTPVFFEFAVTKNQANNLVFSDGGSIAAGTVPLTAMATPIVKQSDFDSFKLIAPYGTNASACTIVANIDTIAKSGFYTTQNAITILGIVDWFFIIHIENPGSPHYSMQICSPIQRSSVQFIRSQINGTWTPWQCLGHTGAWVNDFLLTTTSATTVTTLTPTMQRNINISICTGVVTAATQLTVTLTWQSARGAQSATLISDSLAVGDGIGPNMTINSLANYPITITATAGTANQVYVSASIQEV